PVTYEQGEKVVKFANKEQITFILLGNGCNLIIKDGDIRGIVMYFDAISLIRESGNEIIAKSCALIKEVDRTAPASKLKGLEFACGIPGSVGGALFMNAGAYGGEIKDVLVSATVVDKHGDIKILSAEELDLSYRTSNIPDKGYIVLEATFSLLPGKQEKIKAIMDDLTYRRESKQPLEYPTCGSVFKRPPGYFAGKLIQDSHL